MFGIKIITETTAFRKCNKKFACQVAFNVNPTIRPLINEVEFSYLMEFVSVLTQKRVLISKELDRSLPSCFIILALTQAAAVW